jgi:2'-5' RNA ligase
VNEPVLYEGCVAYAIEEPALARILQARARVLLHHPEAPPHLQLPPHVTVKYLGHQPLSVHIDLQREMCSLSPQRFIVTISKADMFYHRDETCNLNLELHPHAALQALHEDARTSMRRCGCADPDKFAGSNYRPHVTVADGVSPINLKEDLPVLEALVGMTVELSTLILLRKPCDEAVLPEVVARWSSARV